MFNQLVNLLDKKTSLYKKNITVLDIADSLLFLAVYEINKTGEAYSVYAQSFPIQGFANQVITDIKLATETLANIFDQVESLLNIKLYQVIINAPNSQISSYNIEYKQEINSIIKKKHIDQITDLQLYQKDIDVSEFIISSQVSYIYADQQRSKTVLGVWTKNLSSKVNIITIYQPYVLVLKNIFNYLCLELLSIIYIPDIFVHNTMTSQEDFAFLNIEEEETLIGNYKFGTLNSSNIIPIGYNYIYEKLIPIFDVDLLHIKKIIETIKSNVGFKIGEIKLQNQDKNIKISYNTLLCMLEEQIIGFLSSNCILKNLKKVLYTTNILYICSNDVISSIIGSIIYKQTESNMKIQTSLVESTPFRSDREECIRLKLMIRYYLNEKNKNKAILSFKKRLLEL